MFAWVCTEMSADGIAFQYLWPGSPCLNYYARNFPLSGYNNRLIFQARFWIWEKRIRWIYRLFVYTFVLRTIFGHEYRNKSWMVQIPVHWSVAILRSFTTPAWKLFSYNVIPPHVFWWLRIRLLRLEFYTVLVFRYWMETVWRVIALQPYFSFVAEMLLLSLRLVIK